MGDPTHQPGNPYPLTNPTPGKCKTKLCLVFWGVVAAVVLFFGRKIILFG